MKMIIVFDERTNGMEVVKTVADEKAVDAFRAYVKEQFLEFHDDETEESADELIASGGDAEYGLCYNDAFNAASIQMERGEWEYIQLLDAPESEYLENRKADIITSLMRDAGLDEDDDEVPEDKKEDWEEIAKTAAKVFDKIVNCASDEHFSDIYWELIEAAIETARRQLHCQYGIFQLTDAAKEWLFMK